MVRHNSCLLQNGSAKSLQNGVAQPQHYQEFSYKMALMSRNLCLLQNGPTKALENGEAQPLPSTKWVHQISTKWRGTTAALPRVLSTKWLGFFLAKKIVDKVCPKFVQGRGAGAPPLCRAFELPCYFVGIEKHFVGSVVGSLSKWRPPTTGVIGRGIINPCFLQYLNIPILSCCSNLMFDHRFLDIDFGWLGMKWCVSSPAIL